MEQVFGAATLRDASAPHRSRRSRRSRRRSKRVGIAASAVAGLLIAGGAVAYGGSAATSAQRVVVHNGDTLWGIASARYPGDDIRQRVAQIEADNHLRSAALTPGQTLLLPAP